MDSYTLNTKNWLNNRFKACDKEGIYFAHQPIYGFRNGYSEPGQITNYIRTYQILNTLSELKFDTFLDVGAAEGYTAYLVRHFFHAEVEASDLSEEACKRATEIFNIKATPVDIHHLPYKDNQFDVVLCSETLEHVDDFQKAVDELIRVSKKAVIITVPYESKNKVEASKNSNIPHAHINLFDRKSLNFLKSQNLLIKNRKTLTPILKILFKIVEATPINLDNTPKSLKIFGKVFNKFCFVFGKIFGKRTTSVVIQLNNTICKLSVPYSDILFVIIKNEANLYLENRKKVKIIEMINFGVPYHYLNNKV